jgi:hypothetical protein
MRDTQILYIVVPATGVLSLMSPISAIVCRFAEN